MLAFRLCGLAGCVALWALTSAGLPVQAVEMPLPPALKKIALTETEGTLSRNEKCVAPAAMRDLVQQISADHVVSVSSYVAELLRARKWGAVAADCPCLQTIAVGAVADHPDAAARVQASLGDAFPECAIPLQAAIQDVLTKTPTGAVVAAAGVDPRRTQAARSCTSAASCLAIEPPDPDVTPRTQARREMEQR